MSHDPICDVCHEPRSAHVKTEQGPLTHPREARGEGHYEDRGGWRGGFRPGEDYYEFRWVFVPNPPTAMDVLRAAHDGALAGGEDRAAAPGPEETTSGK